MKWQHGDKVRERERERKKEHPQRPLVTYPLPTAQEHNVRDAISQLADWQMGPGARRHQLRKGVRQVVLACAIRARLPFVITAASSGQSGCAVGDSADGRV